MSVTRRGEATAVVPEPRAHPAWWVAVAAAGAIVAAGACTTMSGLLINPLHGQFGWSHGRIGVAISVNMVLYGLTAPFASALMDRFGIRPVVAGALTTVAAGAALTTVVTAAWQLVLSWGLLVGLGTGALAMAFAATVANRWFVRRRGLVTGMLTAASVFGQFAFLPLLSSVVDHAGWRPAVMAVAAVGLLAAPVSWALLRDHPADVGLRAYGAAEFTARPVAEPGALRRSVRVLARAAGTGPFWLLAGMFAICGATTNGIMWDHFVPAAHEHGMPATTAASLLAVIGPCNVVGTIIAGWLTDRLDGRWLLAACFGSRGIVLAFVPVLMAPGADPSMVFFVVVFGLLDVATVPPTIALCRRRYAEDGAVVFGWVNAAHQCGAGLMAVLGAAARDAFGSYQAVWLAGGALCAIAAALSLATRVPAANEVAVAERPRGTLPNPVGQPVASTGLRWPAPRAAAAPARRPAADRRPPRRG
jgi:predicted MFS family arabinose efflux permease